MMVDTSNGRLYARVSLREYKKDITPTQTMLDLVGEENPIHAITPVVYREKADPAEAVSRGQFVHGFIAEDLSAVMPEMAFLDKDGDLIGIAEETLVPLLVAEVQRLAGIVHKLQLAADPNWVKPAERSSASAAAELAVLRAEQARLRALPAEEE